MFSIIVAVDNKRGIGKNGTIPWHLSADLKRFAEITTVASSGKQNVVIMGRKTWESLPEKYRPLPKRLNIVVSRNSNFQVPTNVILADSLDAALTQVQTRNDIDKVFVIGGAQLIVEAIVRQDCDTLYLTELQQSFDCDTFLSAIPSGFKIKDQTVWLLEGDIQYRFLKYSK